MLGNGVSWNNMLASGAADTGAGCFPTKVYTNLLVSSVGYTQGGSADTNAGKVADLTEMTEEFDGLGFDAINTARLKFYYGRRRRSRLRQRPRQQSWHLHILSHARAWREWRWFGPVYASGPSYPYQFNGSDNIHTGLWQFALG
jgi:hypothetical protein